MIKPIPQEMESAPTREIKERYIVLKCLTDTQRILHRADLSIYYIL